MIVLLAVICLSTAIRADVSHLGYKYADPVPAPLPTSELPHLPPAPIKIPSIEKPTNLPVEQYDVPAAIPVHVEGASPKVKYLPSDKETTQLPAQESPLYLPPADFPADIASLPLQENFPQFQSEIPPFVPLPTSPTSDVLQPTSTNVPTPAITIASEVLPTPETILPTLPVSTAFMEPTAAVPQHLTQTQISTVPQQYQPLASQYPQQQVPIKVFQSTPKTILPPTLPVSAAVPYTYVQPASAVPQYFPQPQIATVPQHQVLQYQPLTHQQQVATFPRELHQYHPSYQGTQYQLPAAPHYPTYAPQPQYINSVPQTYQYQQFAVPQFQQFQSSVQNQAISQYTQPAPFHIQQQQSVQQNYQPFKVIKSVEIPVPSAVHNHPGYTYEAARSVPGV